MVYLLIIAGMVGLGVLLSWITIAIAERMIARLIDRTHTEAEVIVENGLVPVPWGKRLHARLLGGAVSKSLALRKLDKIIRFYRYSPLAQPGESKEIRLSRLQQIGAGWRKMRWEEIYPYDRSS